MSVFMAPGAAGLLTLPYLGCPPDQGLRLSSISCVLRFLAKFLQFSFPDLAQLGFSILIIFPLSGLELFLFLLG